jgi:hypothetical protein
LCALWHSGHGITLCHCWLRHSRSLGSQVKLESLSASFIPHVLHLTNQRREEYSALPVAMIRSRKPIGLWWCEILEGSTVVRLRRSVCSKLLTSRAKRVFAGIRSSVRGRGPGFPFESRQIQPPRKARQASPEEKTLNRAFGWLRGPSMEPQPKYTTKVVCSGHQIFKSGTATPRPSKACRG